MDANIQPNNWFTEVSKPKISNLAKFGFLIGMIGVGAVIAAIVQFGFLISMTDTATLLSRDSDKLIEIMAKPENLTKVMLMQVLGTLVMMAVPAYLYARVISKQPLQQLGFSSKIKYQQVLLVIAIAVVGILLSGGLGTLNKMIPLSKYWEIKFKHLEEDYEKQVMIFANMKTLGSYFLSLIMIAILPAIFEELLFRGALQKLLIDCFKKPHIAIVITSILFSAVHFSFYGFLPRMMLGMVLGYLFFYSKNIWLNILMHFINNGVAITAMYIAIKQGASPKDTMNDSFPLWLGAVALVLTIALMVVYKKVCDNSISKFEDVKL
jgi:membrane protease YdiL (CAAX protease family)